MPERIKLSKWLDKNISTSILRRKDLIEIIETIAEATIPIRGLLEKGISSQELEQRMNITKLENDTKNIYEEHQIHEDILTHSIILKALQEAGVNFSFVASEEAEPVLGDGVFGITIDPVDGSSNVLVNRTVGTIVGIYNEKGTIICSFYVLYGIFTNLVIAINGNVAEFRLDTTNYSMTFFHYIFHEIIVMPDNRYGIRCLGGNSNEWFEKFKRYEQILLNLHCKDRYSGSFVGDLHAILKYGGVYSYFSSPKPKIRVYYEWLPLAFIINTLGGEFLAITEENKIEKIKKMEDFKPLTKNNVKKVHFATSGGLIGSKSLIDLYYSI